jgi:DNA primase
MLRGQVLAALAEAAQLAPATLQEAWREDAAQRPTAHAPRAPRWAAARQTPAAVSRHDRAAWLLAHQTELWFSLSEADHALLAGLPLPHGPFFGALERLLHDQHALTLDALAAELAAQPDAELLGGLLERVRALHHFGSEGSAAAELQALMQRLRQEAVDDELQLLMECGELSQEARQRGQELMGLRVQLRRSATLTDAGT